MHDMLRLDVESGVLIGGTEVPHRPVGDHELARHRPHLEAVSPPHRLQRAAHEVLVALLGEPRGAGELDVRFVRAEPHVASHFELEVLDPQAVEKHVLELGAEPLLLDESGE